MFRTYLDSSFHFVAIIIHLFLYIADLYFLFIPLFFIYIISILIFRKNTKSFKETINEKYDHKYVYSPINGKLIGKREEVDHIFFGSDLIELKFVIPWWKESGVYLPQTCEVRDLQSKDGKSFYRLATSPLPEQKELILPGICINLENKKKEKLGLQFIKCNLGQWPEIIAMPGDKGIERANIGFFPLGGTVLLYIPKNYEILINSDSEVVAGQTLLAKVKNE